MPLLCLFQLNMFFASAPSTQPTTSLTPCILTTSTTSNSGSTVYARRWPNNRGLHPKLSQEKPPRPNAAPPPFQPPSVARRQMRTVRLSPALNWGLRRSPKPDWSRSSKAPRRGKKLECRHFSPLLQTKVFLEDPVPSGHKCQNSYTTTVFDCFYCLCSCLEESFVIISVHVYICVLTSSKKSATWQTCLFTSDKSVCGIISLWRTTCSLGTVDISVIRHSGAYVFFFKCRWDQKDHGTEQDAAYCQNIWS